MKKFNETEKELLSQANPVARYWLAEKLKRHELTDKTRNTFIYLNLVEDNIYYKWHQNCREDMKRVKLNECLPELYAYISLPEVSVVKALAVVQRKYAKETNKSRQKQLGKMVAKIQRLDNSKRLLYRQAKEQFAAGRVKNVLEDIASRIENSDEITSENLLFTKQAIKHYLRLTKLGVTPGIDELRLCLQPQFAEDPDLFTKQVNIVYSTYHEGKDVPADIKDACFEFIKGSIKVAGYFHATLIDYIFKNDEISERAFQLFCDAEKYIRGKSMAALPHARAAKLAAKKGLYDKPVAELSDSDVRILRLEKMFA